MPTVATRVTQRVSISDKTDGPVTHVHTSSEDLVATQIRDVERVTVSGHWKLLGTGGGTGPAPDTNPLEDLVINRDPVTKRIVSVVGETYVRTVNRINGDINERIESLSDTNGDLITILRDLDGRIIGRTITP